MGEYSAVYSAVTLSIQSILVVGLIVFAIRGNWESVFLTAAVILLTVLPAFILRQYRIYLPPEFQLLASSFVFLSLFLGSATDFYYQFWWWDDVLHMSSGMLLGIVGFLLLFVLNNTDRLPKGIRPSFLCLFGVTFAVFIGVLWEIFEFAVDQIWPGVNMQSTETGVVDTMHDLIVDTLGAMIVGLMGLAYFKSGRYSFVVDVVKNFAQRNPHLFRKFGRRRTE